MCLLCMFLHDNKNTDYSTIFGISMSAIFNVGTKMTIITLITALLSCFEILNSLHPKTKFNLDLICSSLFSLLKKI